MIAKIAKTEVQRSLRWYGNNFSAIAAIVDEIDFSSIARIVTIIWKLLSGCCSDRCEDKYTPDCTASFLVQVPAGIFFYFVHMETGNRKNRLTFSVPIAAIAAKPGNQPLLIFAWLKEHVNFISTPRLWRKLSTKSFCDKMVYEFWSSVMRTVLWIVRPRSYKIFSYHQLTCLYLLMCYLLILVFHSDISHQLFRSLLWEIKNQRPEFFLTLSLLIVAVYLTAKCDKLLYSQLLH